MQEIPQLYQIDPGDNVATALSDLEPGPVPVLGAASGRVELLERVPRGFKVALRDIPAQGAVVKYGHNIAMASAPIPAGRCVHVHNAKSYLDLRSNTMDEAHTPAGLEYVLPGAGGAAGSE